MAVDVGVAGAALDVRPRTLAVKETGPGSVRRYHVSLEARPLGPVTVVPVSDTPAALRVLGGALTFTPVNYAWLQTVSVEGLSDDVVGARSVRVRHAVSGGGYGAAVAPEVAVEVSDDDAGAVVEPAEVEVRESDDAETEADEREATWTVVLRAVPLGDVVVGLESSDDAKAVVGVAALTFTTADWDEAQTVTVVVSRISSWDHPAI